MEARRRGVLVGVLTLVLSAAAVAPALADDGVSEVQFKLPNRAAVDTLNTMGADLAENVTPGPDGSVYVEAIVTPDQKAQYAALGFQPIRTVADESTWKQATDAADAADRAQADAFRNLRAGKAVANARSKSLAASASDTVNVGRADYFQNYAGRFISIEAHTSDGGVDDRGRYAGPAMTAEWLDGSGASQGSGTLSAFVDDGVYLYHRMLFRVGAVGDGGTMPPTVRVASADGGVDTLAVKQWTSTDGTSSPVGFIDDFNDNYVDPQQAYQRISDLAAQYPNIAQVYDLPNKTNGYQRKSQAIVGTATPYDPRLDSQSSAGTVSNSGADPDTGKAVVVTSRLYGQDGGNAESIAIADPAGAPNQALSVSVSGNDITVDPATGAAGNVTSTSQQVADAINANAAASNLVYAEILTSTSSRGSGVAVNAGHGVVAPTAKTMLSDFLKAPATYPRGPQTVKMLRIGAHRDGSKTGVFIYCQEHAREWATPLVCLETAQRLLVNYATDPETKRLVDNLDIFIIPTINADGAAFSRYDFTMQRKNMFDYCAGGDLATGPNGRNSWGVDINRNFSVGSLFDGYEGASTTCTSEVFAGTGEFSEPESRNEQYVQSTYPNIKFAMNVHSSGGYFMWPPGAYKTDDRVLLPYASPGTNQYFEQTARTVLDRIKSYRGTVVMPARTGPVADVLYSAAGNSADEAYYTHGIIGYDFEIGAQRFTPQDAGTDPGRLSDPGFTPPFANEGHDEGMEFANGNYALLGAALDYENDTTPPTVTPVSSTGSDISPSSYSVTFDQSEAADIWYTTDGSTPTESSAHYGPNLTRGQPVPIPIVGTTTLRWLAKDFKGNVSTGSKTFSVGGTGGVSGTVPATLSLSLGAPASFGPFTPGIDKTYSASTPATVTSTAGDALLTVSDPDTAHPGHLVNGSYFLAQALQMRARDPRTQGSAFNPIGSSYNLMTWDGPTASDPVTLDFQQSIGRDEALRTGSYAKTLTFTLSTTNP
jgi:hypothetical protein